MMTALTAMLRPFLPLAAWLCIAPAHALQALDDEQMSEITGQEGISIGLELRVNADANGDPLTGALSNARPGLGNDINCGATIGGGPCTFALQFANRPGDWLVFKNYSYALKVDQQYLDAAVLSEAADAGTYYNETETLPNTPFNRFQTRNGDCLLNTTDCTNGAVTDPGTGLSSAPAMRMSMPATTASYSRSGGAGGTGLSTGYDSILIGGTLGGLSAEFDGWDGGSAPGWQNPDSSSFLGLNIRDNNSSMAGIRVTGNVFLFGF